MKENCPSNSISEIIINSCLTCRHGNTALCLDNLDGLYMSQKFGDKWTK